VRDFSMATFATPRDMSQAGRQVQITSTNRSANCFDFIRLLAAIAVVIGHATRHLEISFLWLDPGGRYWFRDGVPLFFILSGFLVYRSCERCVETSRPLWQFYLNRLLRVAPAIYAYLLVTVVLLLSAGVIGLSTFAEIPFLLWIASTIALVPVFHPSTFNDFGVGVLNGSLWTIPVECSFYLTVPAAAFAAKRFTKTRMMTVVAIIALLGLFLDWAIVRFLGVGLVSKLHDATFLPYFVYFALGIFWTIAWSKAPKSGGLAIFATIAYLLIRLGPVHPGGLAEMMLIPVWAFPLSYAAIWFGYGGPSVLSKFTSRIGDLSFGAYIWHMVIINFVIFYGPVRNRSTVVDTLTVTVVVLAVCVVAFGSWHLVEKPSLKLKPYTSRSSQEVPASLSRGHLSRARNAVSGRVTSSLE
jgi:peptidoglycan/LPS O-acetylase OafA/YrhL